VKDRELLKNLLEKGGILTLTTEILDISVRTFLNKLAL